MPDRYSHIKAWETKRDGSNDSNESNFCTATEAGTKLPQDVILYGSNGLPMEVNSEGRADVVQHAHPGNGVFHFKADDLTASQDFILIDISDTINFPHVETGYVHLEWFAYEVDASNNAAYELSLGFLENVDGTNGDFCEVYHIGGSKASGQTKDVVLPFYPNGPRMVGGSLITSTTVQNDTAFQTDVNLASIIDPTTPNTPSGNGDVVLRVVITTGTITISMNGAYHTHA